MKQQMDLLKRLVEILKISGQDRREGGGQLGQFALGPTLLGASYSPMSLLSCKNVFNHRYLPRMFIFINKLHILTLPITGALHSLLASSVIHQPSLDHLLNDNFLDVFSYLVSSRVTSSHDKISLNW